MGRIFTAFLFIIIPFVKLFADTDASACDINSACSCWSTNSAACDSAPGCYYDSSTYASGCRACQEGDDTTAGRYGPGCESQCDSITDSSNSSISDFRFGHQHMDDQNNAIRGARTKYECYKKLDKDPNDTDETGHGKKCKDESDHDIEYSADTSTGLKCRQYYRDDGKSYVSCDGTTTGTDSATGNVTDTDSDGNGYHMEGAQCYKNERKCRLFSSNCLVSSESHQVETDDSQQGNVQWGAYIDPNNNETKHKWKYDDTSNCKCKIAGDLTEKSCNGTKYNPIRSMSNTETVNASISYLNPNSPDDSTVWAHYTCTGCLAGYYANGDTNNSFNCVPAPQGYYSTGCGTVWINVDNPTGSGTRDCTLYSGILKPCYAGMTSNSGADSVQDCHYTSQTQFCDAWGCASYSDLVGSNADDWWWYMQSGTTTGGSVNTSIDDIINDPSFE